MLQIVQIATLSDNYVYLIHEPSQQLTAAVDPGVAAPVIACLRQHNWRLTHILNTHHHGDHVGANLELKQASNCLVVGAAHDAARIPGIDIKVSDGDHYVFGASRAQVFAVPGHTHGHIAFWFAEDAALFCGDTLFALGCGHLFEGSPASMWQSLCTLRALPADTRVYCAHEYTLANARFARHVDPNNIALQQRCVEIEDLRARHQPTVPSLLSTELATNPFLRADQPELQRSLGLEPGNAVAAFAQLRQMKDHFNA